MNTHFVITPGKNNENIFYRRDRLVQFIQNLENTSKVIIVSTKEIGFKIGELNIIDNKKSFLLTATYPKNILKYIFQKKAVRGILDHYEKNSRNYLWYTYPIYDSLLNATMWDKVIYDCSDFWVESEKSNTGLDCLKRHLIKKTQENIISGADICFASSLKLKKIIKKHQKEAILIENGVNYKFFQKKLVNSELNNNKGVTLGFIGGLKSWKLNYNLLLVISKLRPDWKISLIGKIYGEEIDTYKSLLSQPNVIKMDEVDVSEVPRYLSEFDLGILPYLDNEYNKGVFPLKFFEYLAAGLPVVGCGLPSTLHYCEEGIYEHTENDAVRFVEACERALAWGDHYKDQRLALAKEADWEKKFQTMWDLVRAD
ncbi:glycosyltransferase [Paenibacillus sp. IB182496]|uniref:Glycosyltransferase n=1 Tax=Paenibacillus sabuli TaxID=2772509 RepID=A0A927BSF0_9BACL|nr:glycosyltransferase [Paenibacillus sabuli]MBD2845922.1 glycosyltransferase [Paenibacillus sabuli]